MVAAAVTDATSVSPMENITDALGLDDLLAWLILAVGGAMVLGNGAAIWMDRQGKTPEKADGEFRPARAWWLFGVGAFIAAWGIGSLVTG